jgi:hypothetical protein
VNAREQALRSAGNEASERPLAETVPWVEGMWCRQRTEFGRPPRRLARTIDTGKTQAERCMQRSRSGVMAGISAGSEVLVQKVIGRVVTAGAREVWSMHVVRDVYRALPLLDQPARQVGGGGFLQPLIEKRGDFLFQIGGVSEPREFIGLKGVARGGEKKFPRRLSAALGHENLPEGLSGEYGSYINHTITYHGIPYASVYLWMTVENAGEGTRCCSSCSGDYEDPDATGWEEDFELEEDETGPAEEN